MSEDKKSFAERYMAFRKEVSQMDWEADGTNTNQGYTYLSEHKIKGQLAPALVKHDLGLKTDYDDLRILEPVGSMKQHYIVRVTVTIFEVVDGQPDGDCFGKQICFTAYGEGADSGDKAISKTHTNALKNAIANNLLLSSYSVKGEDAIESKASSNVNQEWGNKAVKQEAKEILQQTNPKPENATAPAPTTKGINGVQANAMEKIMTKLRVIDPIAIEEYGGISAIEIDYNAVKQKNDPLLAAKFIQKYKVIV